MGIDKPFVLIKGNPQKEVARQKDHDDKQFNPFCVWTWYEFIILCLTY